MITLESLQNQINLYRQQEKNASAQANCFAGAAEALEALKPQLVEPLKLAPQEDEVLKAD
jgi:hypothetical protein